MNKILKILSRNHFLPTHLITAAVFDLILIQLPLTNVFDYEYAALNAILLYFLAGFHGISLIRKVNSHRTGISINIIARSLSLMILMPFAIALVNELFLNSCDFVYGCLFYLILTVPSAIIGYSVGLYCFSLHQKFTKIIFIFISVIIMVIPLSEIYLLPQVYFFNPVAGYFPGNIYDEGITVTAKLIIYRSVNLFFFLSVALIVVLNIKRNSFLLKIFLYLLVPAVSVMFILYSPELGFSTTENSLREHLKGRVLSEHFQIYFPERLDENEVKWLVLKHEYSYQSAANFLDVLPGKRITSFVFESREQKRILFGAGNADVAKPWLNHIYLTFADFDETVKHEIAHCLSSNFGSGMLKLAAGLNPSLIEGIAQATDPFYDDLSINFLAQLALLNGYQENIEALFSNFNFFTVNSSLSYIYSGAFVKFLIDSYGINIFKKYYLDGDFTDTYGKPMKNIISEFFSSIRTDSSAILNNSMADYYFGKPALIYKKCPRSVARDLDDAWKLVNRYDYTGARNIFSSILDNIVNYSAISGLVYIYQKKGENDSAIGLLKSTLNDFRNSSDYFNLKFQLADLFVKTGNFSDAESIYEEIKIKNPNIKLSLLASVRLELLKNKVAHAYISGSEFDRYTILNKINQNSYCYESFHLLISLSESLNEDSELFLRQFNRQIEVKNFASSYGALAFSRYLMENLKFNFARRLAALATRYKDDPGFTLLLKDNLSEAEWYLKNAGAVLAETVIN